jgi:hypothetical protein
MILENAKDAKSGLGCLGGLLYSKQKRSFFD